MRIQVRMTTAGFALFVALLLAASQPDTTAAAESCGRGDSIKRNSVLFDEQELPEIVSLSVTPTKLETNRINFLKLVIKFKNPNQNLIGGRLYILYNFSPYTGKSKGIGNFIIEDKKFNKKKGTFTTYVSLLAERWETCDLTVQLMDTLGKRSPESEPVTLTHEPVKDGETQGIKRGRYAYDFTLIDPQGKQVALSDYRGKVVLLNFCSMWCSICRTEAQHLEELYQKYKDDGLVIITVLAGDIDGMNVTADECRLWVKEFGLTSLVLGDTPRGTYQIYFWGDKVYYQEWGTAYPYNFVIYRDGKIFWKKKGYRLSKIENKIKAALKK
jgi:peroxiredoxin